MRKYVSNIPKSAVLVYINDEEIVRTIYKSIYRSKNKKFYDNKITQLMSALNGGLIVQDVKNHAIWGTHEITNGKDKYQITSTHHQMQYPYNLPKEDYDVLFWTEGLSDGYYAGDKIDPEIIIKNGEPEIVLYHKKNMPKCLAIQGHPEIMEKCKLHDMLNNLLIKYGKI